MYDLAFTCALAAVYNRRNFLIGKTPDSYASEQEPMCTDKKKPSLHRDKTQYIPRLCAESKTSKKFSFQRFFFRFRYGLRTILLLRIHVLRGCSGKARVRLELRRYTGGRL